VKGDLGRIVGLSGLAADQFCSRSDSLKKQVAGSIVAAHKSKSNDLNLLLLKPEIIES